MSIYYISFTDWKRLLEKLLQRGSVYAPKKINNFTSFFKVSPTSLGEIVYNLPRTTEVLKSFFFRSKEVAASYFSPVEKEGDQVIIIGGKACDLAALKILDEVFTSGDFRDPSYLKIHEKSLIIGSDCQYTSPTCFCTLVGRLPYAKEGFDLNLSQITKGFTVEIGSKKGEKLFDEYKFLFRDATTEEIEEQLERRTTVETEVNNTNKKFSFRTPYYDILKSTFESSPWRVITKNCVECGACNLTCPTCQCFLLYDQKAPERTNYEKIKMWDACLKIGYGLVAGGVNPRPSLYQRLNNRYQCKFVYMYDRINVYTCVGCGRCIDACPAKIDMREALQTLEAHMALTIKLE